MINQFNSKKKLFTCAIIIITLISIEACKKAYTPAATNPATVNPPAAVKQANIPGSWKATFFAEAASADTPWESVANKEEAVICTTGIQKCKQAELVYETDKNGTLTKTDTNTTDGNNIKKSSFNKFTWSLSGNILTHQSSSETQTYKVLFSDEKTLRLVTQQADSFGLYEYVEYQK